MLGGEGSRSQQGGHIPGQAWGSAHNTFISTFLCCQGWMGFKTGLMLPVIYNSTASYPGIPLTALEKIWQTGLVLVWSCTMGFQTVLVILREQITECYCSGNESGLCTFLLKTGRRLWPTTVSEFVNWLLTSTGLTALACLSNHNIISHFAVHNIDCCSLASLRNILWKNENTRSNF